MSDTMTPVEMFNELVRLGYVVPGQIEPSRLKEPTAYISVPTALVFASPPIEVVPVATKQGQTANAELGSRSKPNSKRKRRSARR